MKEYVERIVERYIGKGNKKGTQISLKCPFHKGGQETRASFSINTEKGLFHCFTCHVSGTIPMLLKLLGLSAAKIDIEIAPIREALEANRRNRSLEEKVAHTTANRFIAAPILKESVLVPYQWCPIALVEAGFDEAWLKYMEVGFDRKKNRITYPIRDMFGNLAGVSGGPSFEGQTPKYKVYKGAYVNSEGIWIQGDFGPGFDEDYPRYAFQNHGFLWNYEKVYPRLFWGGEDESIVIVEGFKACLWLLQLGFWSTVALMGSSLSKMQMEQLLRLNVNVILMLDNDDAGIAGTKKTARKLLGGMKNVKVAKYPEDSHGCQPDDFNAEELQSIIEQAIDHTKLLGKTHGN